MSELYPNPWTDYQKEKPPYADNPTWYWVKTTHGMEKLCRWWDDWYCAVIDERDIIEWRKASV